MVLTKVKGDDAVSGGRRQQIEVFGFVLELAEEALLWVSPQPWARLDEAGHVVGLEQRLCLLHGEHCGLLLNVTAEGGREGWEDRGGEREVEEEMETKNKMKSGRVRDDKREKEK